MLVMTPFHHTITVLQSLFLECLLNGLHLLGHSRQHSLLQTVELVKASPGAYLTQPDEYATHCLRGKERKRWTHEQDNTCLNNCRMLCLCQIYHTFTTHEKCTMPKPTWKSNVSSQLKTNTNLPNWLPKAFTDSVLPVPAGPGG